MSLRGQGEQKSLLGPGRLRTYQRESSVLEHRGREVGELMEILFQLLQLNPFNLPLNRQADFAVIYLCIPLSELFFLVKTQTAPREGICHRFCFLYIPGPQHCWLLSFYFWDCSCLSPQGPALLRTQVTSCHPPSCPSEECVVGRRCRLTSSPSEGICILISPALALPF